MFTETTYDAMWGQKSRRGWTTIASFMLQSLGIGLLLTLPLIYTQGLPDLRLITGTIALPVPAGNPQVHPATHPAAGGGSNFWGRVLMRPERIPRGVPNIDDHGVVPLPPGIPTVAGGTREGTDPNGVIGSILAAGNRVITPPHSVQQPIRVSRMMEGYLIRRVEPIYPPLAKLAHVQGPVLLSAVISRQGTIENLQVLSGHPMLAGAARNAVQQWRYRPYVLNGEPVEVETQVTVNFVLSR